MLLDEETLDQVARDGEMDYEKWPGIIDPLLERLNHIVYHEFPIPRPYTNVNRAASPSQARSETNDPSQAAGQTPSTPVRNLPPVPLFPNSSATSATHIPDSLPPSQTAGSSDDLPLVLLHLLNGIIATLKASFTNRPPHTVQRLAELILYPTKHYKTLPAWLRAVDRVVNVSSSADVFPLSEQPVLTNGVNGEVTPAGDLRFLSSASDAGTRNGYDSASLGSDESLGGALLTPIPWLRNGSIGHNEGDSEESAEEATQSSSADTDDGLGDPIALPSANTDGDSTMASVTTSNDPFVPERPEGAVTQGELIRMEQEAGVVPISASNSGPPPMQPGLGGDEIDGDEMASEGPPHARGPDLVGAVDMGKVEGRNVEVRIGSPPMESETAAAQQERGKEPSTAEDGDYEMIDKDAMEVDESTGAVKADVVADGKDKDEDMVLVDAEGSMDDDEGAAASNATKEATSG